MRDNPRYSIIPAGAVTDKRLEGRDLQVLCLLGSHTDKLGWCPTNSQAELAEMIDCSRQTFQRSISRLVKSGWVQTKSEFVSQSGRPYAPYAYRVIMDRDHPDIPPQEHEVAPQGSDEGAHRRAPLPIHGGHPTSPDGQGCPDIHGQQESGPLRDQEVVVSARAREPLVGDEAIKVANEIAAIAGQGSDPKSFDPGWHGAPMRVQAFLNEGFHPEHLIIGARLAMAGKPAGFKPWSIDYFAKPFARAKSTAEAPVPRAEAPASIKSGGAANEARNRNSDRRGGSVHSAISEYADLAKAAESDASSADREDPPRLLSNRGSG